MGRGLPHSEFTIAKAARKAPGNYATIMLGKWLAVWIIRDSLCATLSTNALLIPFLSSLLPGIWETFGTRRE